MKSPLPLLAALSLAACLTPASLRAVVTLNPDGANDRTTAINNAISSARAAGDYVMLNAGTYHHSGIINLSGAVELRGAGDSTILHATNDLNNACVKMTGTGPKLRNMLVRTSYTGPFGRQPDERVQNNEANPVWVQDAVDFLVENVSAQKTRGAGIMVNNSRGVSSANKARIVNCRVRDSLADGIHITNASKWIRVENCNNTNTGDDLIAIVSKATQSACTDIIITNNTVSEGKWGRGISVVGGTNVQISNNTITNPDGSGIYLVAETGYDAGGISGIAVSNNTVTGANTGNKTGHNGITISGRDRNGTILKAQNITFTNNTVTNSKGRGVSVGPYTSGITFNDLKVDGTTAAGVEISAPGNPAPPNSVPTNISIIGSSTTASYIKNTGVQGVSASVVTGAVKVQNTRFEQINKNGVASIDVIRVADNNGLTATITGNHYANPSGNSLRNYIRCEEPSVTAISPVNTKAAGITTPSSPTSFSP